MKTLFFLAIIHLLCAGNTTTVISETGVSSTGNPAIQYAPTDDTTTLNGQWYLQPLLASDTAAGKIPVLQINLAAKTFAGNTGCNTMRGNFQKTDSSLVFNENIMTTKMYCAGYDEAAFLKSLQRTNRCKLENGELILLFDATELSRWTRKPSKKIKINKA